MERDTRAADRQISEPPPRAGQTGRFQNDDRAFWRKVAVGGPRECWPWTASRRNGYGRFTQNYVGLYAHRVAYLLAKGPIGDGLMVMHSCNNKACCNPAHLQPGTAQQNTEAAYRDGLAVSGERHHRAKLTEQQVRAIRADGRRQVDIAADHGVTQQVISRIKSQKIWRRIA